MKAKLTKKAVTLFENIKKIDEEGREYWSSRDLAKILEYKDYRNFLTVINKAKESCSNSNIMLIDHFVDVTDMVLIGSGAGVIKPYDYAVFQNYGYKGLYGGLGAKEIHFRKGLKKNQKILDHMGSTELAANLFRTTQTEEKLRRENIKGKAKANQTHYDVGKKVRQTIEDLGGTMPEDLPSAESIKTIEAKQQKEIKE